MKTKGWMGEGLCINKTGKRARQTVTFSLAWLQSPTVQHMTQAKLQPPVYFVGCPKTSVFQSSVVAGA